MNTLQTVLAATLALATLGASSGAVAAGADHSNRISCYAYVHGQCHGGANSCSDDDYQWGLDQCDTTYPSTATIARPPAPAGLTAGSTSREIRATIARSMQRR